MPKWNMAIVMEPTARTVIGMKKNGTGGDQDANAAWTHWLNTANMRSGFTRIGVRCQNGKTIRNRIYYVSSNDGFALKARIDPWI